MKRLILTAALALGLMLPALAQGAIPQPIYFWYSVVATISAPGQRPAPEVIRPSVIGMFADGSWDIDHLHWTGWGSSVANAQGISSKSNGIPNVAEGKRTKKPAQVILSNPGRFQGREVYRCFTLTVPSHPAFDQHLCLERAGSGWALGPTPPKGNASTPAGIRRVSFYSPSRNLSCVMLDGSRTSSFRNGVHCQSVDLPHAVGMGLDGQLKICHGLTACVYPNPGVSDIPKMVLGYGKQITVGRFRCLSQRSGVTCTVIQSGKGFLIASAGVTRVGP
jgi:hypothetical protein